MSERKYCVYYHKNTINDKYYVGCTFRPLIVRFRKDGSGYKENCKFWEEIVEYGWNNFDHVVVKNDLSKDEAYALEKELIEKFDAVNNGYNRVISHGGSAKGRKYTQNRNEKLKNSKLGNSISKGRIQIHKDDIEKMIYPEEFEYYADIGFVRGLSDSHKQKCSNGCKGKIWITNGQDSKSIYPEDFKKYAENGYKRGRVCQRKYRAT